MLSPLIITGKLMLFQLRLMFILLLLERTGRAGAKKGVSDDARSSSTNDASQQGGDETFHGNVAVMAA